MGETRTGEGGGGEKGRKVPSPLERIPAPVREAFDARKREEEEEEVRKYVERIRSKRRIGAAAGAAAELFPALMLGSARAPFLAFVVLGGAAIGWLIVDRQWGPLLGVVAFGGFSISASLLGFQAGVVEFNPYLCFFAWLFWLVGGAFLAHWAQEDESMRG